jgi:hypothetical protein
MSDVIGKYQILRKPLVSDVYDTCLYIDTEQSFAIMQLHNYGTHTDNNNSNNDTS